MRGTGQAKGHGKGSMQRVSILEAESARGCNRIQFVRILDTDLVAMIAIRF